MRHLACVVGTICVLFIAVGPQAQATGASINVNDTGGFTSFNTPAYNFISNESLTSFASTSTHFGAVFQNGKQVTGSNTTGSRNAFTAQQLGAGGSVAGDFFTAAFELTQPCNTPYVCNSFNLSGSFTANNPYVFIPFGMTPASAVGEEIDITTNSPVSNIREALRIVDIGSTGSLGAGIDAAIGISSNGTGFKHGIFFGDSGGLLFPIAATGDLIGTVPSSVVLNSFINLTNLTSLPTVDMILLPPALGGVCWGTTTACVGGRVQSQTATGGGAVLFTNGTIFLQQSGVNTFSVTSTGTTTSGAFRATNLVNTTNAPTILSGFGTSPFVTSNNGTWAFRINVGMGGSANSGVIGLPAAATGWNCNATDITTKSSTVFLTKQTASSTTTVTLENFNAAGAAAAWAANDILAVQCAAL